MLFEKAWKLLQEGKHVSRAIWTAEDGYLTLLPSMKYVWKIVLLPNPNAGNFIFCVDDFTTDDWMEYVEPVETLSDPASP
jgi:hypothetical protein